jgi:hypothetical protein
MCEALFALQLATDPIKNTTASKPMLMVWQARYLSKKCRSARTQGKVDSSTNTVPRPTVDEDYNERIETLMHSLKAELTAVWMDLDDILPYVSLEMSADDASGLDMASVGTLFTAAELAQHQDALHADPSIQDPHRDHRITCALCREPCDADDPALMLRCGHVAGDVCMAAWVASANTQATSCPHCQYPLLSLQAPPKLEQTHCCNLIECYNTVEGLFSYAPTTALEVYGAKTAMKWGDWIMRDTMKGLRRNSSRFRVEVAEVEGEEWIEVVTLKRRGS